MKKWMLLVGIATALYGCKLQKYELASLHPVELLSVSVEGLTVYLETDTGQQGSGNSVKAALEDLRAGATGTLFLDTVDYLLLSENAQQQKALQPYLRDRCMLCAVKQNSDLTEAASFLAGKELSVTLRSYMEGSKPEEVLTEENGNYRLITE